MTPKSENKMFSFLYSCELICLVEHPFSNYGNRLQGTGQNCGLVSRNRPVSTGFYKGFSVSFLVLDQKKVLYLEV